MGEQKIDQQLLEVGELFEDKFEILSVLGRGANGIVYKARHLLLQTFAALKVINQNSSDPELASQRFQKEAALLSSFDHPNIVKLHSYGILPDGRQYMALEFIEGEPLSALIARSGPLQYARAIAIFKQICSALSYSHSRDVVHRDIKPENVMIDADEKAKILDFGIFKSLDLSSQDLTKTGHLLGSANYMSPEQCKQQVIDQRSDIYSLGCLMYECLVGQPPMQDASDMAIMANQMEKIIDQVPARNGISEKLEGAILRCLEKDPSKRFQSATELEILLADCAKAPLIEKHETPSGSRSLWLPIAVAFFVIAGALGVWRYWQGQQTKKAISGIAPTTPSSLLEAGRILPPDGVRTVKSTDQRERWIERNGSHAEAKQLIEQYALCWHHRREQRRSVPPPHGDIVKARLQSLLDQCGEAEGRFGMLRDLAHLSALMNEDAAVEHYVSELEKKGDPLYEGNRRKALNAAIFSIVNIYHTLGRENEGLVLLKREDATALGPEERLMFFDNKASMYINLQDITNAEPYALKSAELLKQQMTQSKKLIANVIYPILARLNQVSRSDVVLEVAQSLPPITPEMRQNDPDWRRIDCELANAFLNTNQLEKAETIYLDNIEEIRKLESSEEVLAAEKVILTILYKQKKIDQMIQHAKEYLGTVNPSSFVTASRQVVNMLLGWKVDATALEPPIFSVAKARERIDPSRSHRLYETLGKIFLHARKLEKASNYFDQARRLSEAAGDEAGVASSLTGKMTCLIYEKKMQEFMVIRQALLKLNDIPLDEKFAADELLGLLYEMNGNDHKKAIEIYEKLLTKYEPRQKKDQIPAAYCDCALHLAICYKAIGQDDKALRAAERGIAAAKSARKHSNAELLYEYAAQLCGKSDPQKAIRFRRTASKLRKV